MTTLNQVEDPEGLLPTEQEAVKRPPIDFDVLRDIERRVLWLAVRMIDWANRREDTDIKVGGHQASSASMVSIMTALWFGHLRKSDKVSVKPHAAPVYHAIKYLVGDLDRSYLTSLRQLGGLQAYPSRTKDPDVPDFSTGSVGHGAVAPLFSAVTQRYIERHFGLTTSTRFIGTVGDAELDEGNVWEAIADPVTHGLGNVNLIVDLNRQSLDRVIPGIQVAKLRKLFADSGWHVTEAKYGSLLCAAFDRPGGKALRDGIDAMSNEAYQSLLGLAGPDLRTRLRGLSDPSLGKLLEEYSDNELAALIRDLGGHDLGLLIRTLEECDSATDRPSVLFAYTIKGWGLPFAGDPLNHAALLNDAQIDQLRASVGLTEDTEWDRFEPDSDAGRLCSIVAGISQPTDPVKRPRLPIPTAVSGARTTGHTSTQEALGRTLARLAVNKELVPFVVTAAPDVSISTNLGGWINRVGVYSHQTTESETAAPSVLKWEPSPSGQHIELGISEMNLFGLLGQMGLSHEHHGQVLLPVGTVYDPFILRGLDALVYGLYNDARFVIAGTPSGVSLAPEGGAHQSSVTASLGLELPGICYVEPAFASEVDWLLCDGLRRLLEPKGESLYMRLSTRPMDQSPFGRVLERVGEERLRDQVLAGGYRLVEGARPDWPGVVIVATGVAVAQAVDAADQLGEEGVDVTVIQLTSPDRAYRSWLGAYKPSISRGRFSQPRSLIHRLITPSERGRPIVSVHDASSHALSWLGSALGTTQLALGVDRFGESGNVEDLHRIMGTSIDSIVNAALVAIELV